MNPDAKAKTGFVTPHGKYQFKRMPFGFINAPMSFQSMMLDVLRGLAWKNFLAYIDDLIIQRLRSANLTLKPSKCKFASWTRNI